MDTRIVRFSDLPMVLHLELDGGLWPRTLHYSHAYDEYVLEETFINGFSQAVSYSMK